LAVIGELHGRWRLLLGGDEMKNLSYVLIDENGHAIHIMADNNRVVIGISNDPTEQYVSLSAREAKAIAKAIKGVVKSIKKKGGAE
jgi:hypothetical protein